MSLMPKGVELIFDSYEGAVNETAESLSEPGKYLLTVCGGKINLGLFPEKCCPLFIISITIDMGNFRQVAIFFRTIP